MNLNGQIEHFDMTLSSTPSLEETQILSLLTLGTLGTGSTGIEGGINLSAATSFLSGQLQDIAQERVKSITGIDRIGTESYTSRVTGKSEQRFMVSKRLIGDKLSVTYATSFNSVETSVIRIEYNIGGNMTLIGLKDESGGLGGNIKFRFSFK
jgi:translocation and assembly module TamB